MADTLPPPVRIARVTTRRMHTQTIKCPLDPEMLVAEFAGELPPDIARHVREHLLFCQTCSARSQALRSPYELLSSLGTEPVPYVTDLRDSVRVRVRSRRVIQEIARFVARMGRGGAIVLTGILGLAVIGVFLAVAFLFPAIAGVTARSQNALTNPPSAAPSGILFAETNKLVPMTDSAGKTWQVAEVIAVDQHTGRVLHSLPDAGGTLHIAQQNQLPVATQISGNIIVEVTAPGADGRQALVSFDATSGTIHHITALRLPDGATAASLAVAPDHSVAYVGLMLPNPLNGTPNVIKVDLQNGQVIGSLTPGYDVTAPLPPPPGSLPISAFPSAIPHLDTSGMAISTGMQGALVLSPDGHWLFDVLALKGADQKQYVVIRRFDPVTGTLAQELALPGDFSLAQMLGGNVTDVPQVYIVSGGADANCYVLDASDQGPTLTGRVPLGGPLAPAATQFTGSLHLTVAAKGDRLYVTQDITSTDNQISGHDVWVVDTRNMALAVHHSTATSAGMVLPNGSTQQGALTFALRDDVVNVTDAELNGALRPWLQLNDGKPVILLATETR